MTATRAALPELTPRHVAALGELSAAIDRDAIASGLPRGLLELVRIRVSQINRCTYCQGLHSRAASACGESVRRLDALADWRRQPEFGAAERAALALAEALTHIEHGVPENVYRAAAEHFTLAQLASLLWVITLINAYNRLAISTGMGRAAIG
jgi:AhpD family alkylhydroperoxidase